MNVLIEKQKYLQFLKKYREIDELMMKRWTSGVCTRKLLFGSQYSGYNVQMKYVDF